MGEGSGERKKQQRREKKKASRLEAQRARRREPGRGEVLQEVEAEVVPRTLSAQLLAFAEPLLKGMSGKPATDEAMRPFRLMLRFAMLAWNEERLDPEGRAEVRRTADAIIEHGADPARMRRAYELLLERRRTLFAEDPRLVSQVSATLEAGEVQVVATGAVAGTVPATEP